MSGGRFNFYDEMLVNSIFGHLISTTYGFGTERHYSQVKAEKGGYDHYSICMRQDYLENLKAVRKKDPFNNLLISELVYDVMCLLHSFDWCESGDTGDDQWNDDQKAFVDKWFGKKSTIKKEIVDAKIEQTKEEIYRAVGIE